jgi:hypothetical protein
MQVDTNRSLVERIRQRAEMLSTVLGKTEAWCEMLQKVTGNHDISFASLKAECDRLKGIHSDMYSDIHMLRDRC